MDYNHITGFLEKFRKILFEKEGINTVIVETITKHIKYPIETNMIKINGTVIHIKASPMLRSEILMHKEAILSDLSNMVTNRNFSDIK